MASIGSNYRYMYALRIQRIKYVEISKTSSTNIEGMFFFDVSNISLDDYTQSDTY